MSAVSSASYCTILGRRKVTSGVSLKKTADFKRGKDKVWTTSRVRLSPVVAPTKMAASTFWSNVKGSS